MKTIFTVFNASGNLVASPEHELINGVTSEQLRPFLSGFRVGNAGHGITLRAEAFLIAVPDADLVNMVNGALLGSGLVTETPFNVLVSDPCGDVLRKLDGFTHGEGAQALVFVARGDNENILYQIRHLDTDTLLFNLSADKASAVPAFCHFATALEKVHANLNDWAACESVELPLVTEVAAEPVAAKGANPGVRLLTAADIQTMFSLTFPGFDIPELDTVLDHPASLVAEILATYGEADSASNALSREVTPVAEPVASVAAAPALRPEDFNYDRDREELARVYNVRFRGIIIDSNNDPFEGTYVPHDVAFMEGALNYLNDKLVWVNFPVVGNGGSWRIWLQSVAGKRPVAGPGQVQEVEVPPAGKSLSNSMRRQLGKLAAPTAPSAEKSNTTAVNAASGNPLYFNVKMAETEEFRVVVRGVDRIPAVEQGVATFLSRELAAASLHAASSTFNLTRLLSAEQITVAVRTALQMLGLNAADIDVEPMFMPVNEQYIALMA